MRKTTYKVVSLICTLVAARCAGEFNVYGDCWVPGEELCLAAGYCLSETSGQCTPAGSYGPVTVDYCAFFTGENVNRPKVQNTPPGHSGHVGKVTFTYQTTVSITERILNGDCSFTDIPNLYNGPGSV